MAIALPPELVQKILTIVASTSYTGAKTVSLVCSWARTQAIVHLYRTVVLRDHSQERRFRQAIGVNVGLQQASNVDTKPPPLLALLVRNLWPSEVSRNFIKTYIACANLRNLALSPGHLDWIVHELHMSSPSTKLLPETSARNRDLSVLVREVLSSWGAFESHYWNPQVLQWVSRITHLTLIQCPRQALPTKSLHLGSLTHLAVGWQRQGWRERMEQDMMFQQLLKLPNLAIFVVLDMNSTSLVWTEMEQIMDLRRLDSRMHVLQMPMATFQEHWEREMRGGPSLWDRAVEYTAQVERERVNEEDSG